MRVLVVSAHYPPNFVSGGTLVPFWSARELARRGHDVRVFAGWIGPTHASGDAFDAPPTEAGGEEARPTPLRWFTTNDAIQWTSRTNYDNPAATAEFLRTLRNFSPDVVHFHSMQGLGAGLLEVAARARVPFVVTAHDFWWWCGRQFFCDRDYHPCCPVVDGGVCPCAVDRDWLDERNRSTTSALARAARLVAVSESSAAVLRANGVPGDRLVVIDNPVEGIAAHDGADGTGRARTASRASDTGDAPASASAPERDVSFVFAGGSDPMKGLPVLRDALAALEGTPGWTADLYGVDESVPPSGDRSSSRVRTHPAFAPADLARVLSTADVLVVPSVMQETYSILTREALGMGVPVLTTTCLGPEEVVVDRVNGLVVPQDDPGALAAAMNELAGDRALLTRLGRAARGVDLTSVEAHTDRLEELYASVVEEAAVADDREAAPLAPATRASQVRRSIRRVLFVAGIDGAPLRYRARLPAEGLGLLGVQADVRHYRHPEIVGLAELADAVVLYRVPATHQIRRFVDDVRGRGTPVLFDVDDLIFDPDLGPEIPALAILTGAERDLWLQGVHRYRTTMELCDAFVGSTQGLCDHASAVTGLPTFRFPNGAGLVMSKLADGAIRQGRKTPPHEARGRRRLRMGYLSGTDTHDHDWAMIEDAVVATMQRFPDTELWLVGKLKVGPAVGSLGERVKLVPFQPWRSLPHLLWSLDVNLAPLVPTSRFNDAKSAIKWLEAGLSSTPTIATPTQPFREAVEDGVNGMLADGPEEWQRALSALLDDEVLRRRLGQRARRDALLRFGPWTQGRRYLEILQSVEPRASTTSAWQPELLDEPFEPIDLEPYDEPEIAVPAEVDGRPGRRLRTLAGRGAASVRRRGALRTSVLVLERVGRRVRRG